ncbi:MAG: CinA family protein [Candidatus Omnitrophota bacterium]
MQHIARQINKLLIKKNKTVAVAESCTGGLISYLLTSISGSSTFFLLGLVTYSNAAKTKLLNIPSSIILKNGAVSKVVANLMAQRIQKISGSDIGIGISGIAGPSGGTPQKPVGTIYISIVGKKKAINRRFIFKGNRRQIRKLAAIKALQILMTVLVHSQKYTY